MEAKTETLTWEVVDEKALMQNAIAQYDEAKVLEIDSGDMYEIAGELLVSVKTELKRLEVERREIVDPLNKVVKTINAKYKPASEKLDNAERVLKGAMGAWDQKQIEEQRQLRIAAERKAAAEQARIEKDAREAEERARALAEEAAKSADPEVIEQAAVAQAEADIAVENASVPVAAVVPIQSRTVAPGVSGRDRYTAVITNQLELLAHILANPSLLHLIDFRQGDLDRLAQAQKALFKLPGVRLEVVRSVSVRTA